MIRNHQHYLQDCEFPKFSYDYKKCVFDDSLIEYYMVLSTVFIIECGVVEGD